MHVTDCIKTQKEDLVLDAVLNLLEVQKKSDLKTLLGEHTSSKRGPIDLKEWPEFYNLPECPLPTFNA